MSSEHRAQEAEARSIILEQRLEALTKEFNAMQQQRIHDNGLRDQLHKQQLMNQEEKVQTLEKRLRQVTRDKDQFQLDLETKKAEKPNGLILKQVRSSFSILWARLFTFLVDRTNLETPNFLDRSSRREEEMHPTNR